MKRADDCGRCSNSRAMSNTLNASRIFVSVMLSESQDRFNAREVAPGSEFHAILA